MTDTPRTRTGSGQVPPAKGQARDDRLRAALKANMARRKAQAKARDVDRSDPGQGRQQETE